MGYTIWPDGYAGDAVSDIYRERQRQDTLKQQGKFRYTCADSPLSHAERLAVLAEEFGEVAHEVNEGINRPIDNKLLRTELIQVAAVCVAWIEAIDRSEHDDKKR